MGGISTGSGLFSGIDTRSLIDQLLAIEARPRIISQRRILQLQSQQAAYLDLNSRLSTLKSAAGAFRVNKVFDTNKATSSNTDVLTATASASASPGSYSFIVDRLVSSQQMLSRGFASATSGVGATSITFESAAARLDAETRLADLNGGEGVERGKIVIADAGGRSATIDLSKAATVSDVLDAINSATGIDVAAKVDGGRLVISSDVASNLTITSAAGYSTAASLGIERTTASSTTVTGSVVHALAEGTALSLLNDGNGIFVNSQVGSGRYDLQVKVTGGAGTTTVNVNVGTKYDAQGEVTEAAPTTVGGVLKRINDALATALGDSDMKASVASSGTGLQIVDTQGRTIEVLENSVAGSTTAADLGLLTTSAQVGTVAGTRVLAAINSTLGKGLNGGAGIGGTGTITITGRDGNPYTVSIDRTASISEMLAEFSADTAGKITAKLNDKGTGIVVTDATGGTGNLIISGTTAESLGIDTTGVASSTVDSGNLQRQYITVGTRLESLRGGQGVGEGTFRITDSNGATALVTVDESEETLQDIIALINSRGTRVKAKINSKGDGLELYEATVGGSTKIKVEDTAGAVAAGLNIKGEAAGTGAANVIDGSLEKTVTLAATDSLREIASKINAAGAIASASVISDGSGATPNRLSLSARSTGTAGRFIVDSGSFDLGASTLDAGRDSRVFFGSTDPARAVLLSSSTNTLDSVITGVSIDLQTTSEDPVNLTIASDTGAIEESVNTFVTAFNDLVARIDQQTKYDAETETRGTLLGDSTAITLRQGLFTAVQGKAIGIQGSFDDLADIGIRIGEGSKLTLDRDKLRAAIEQDAEGVEQLLAARTVKPKEPTVIAPGVTVSSAGQPDEFSALGIGSIVENLADAMINTTTGRLTKRRGTIDDQIASENKRIDSINDRLTSRRTILERQFLAMEQAIGRLQQQQGALSQIRGL
ncbi:MAG: flagellar filament capping protein FliD [Phycisphaerales bacterium]